MTAPRCLSRQPTLQNDLGGNLATLADRFVVQLSLTAYGVRRAKAALFQWVKGPPGELLQPEAPGATMEVTKWLKPLVKRVTKYGDSASVQAVT